jgi:hypothetical protein
MLHAAGTQIVPLALLRQAPAPSQLPSLPQVETATDAHCSSGSWPAGTIAHVPELPERLQERQVPAQVVEQHTPCWHRPVAHWLAAVHAAPVARLRQAPPMHSNPDAQSAIAAQLVRQRPAVPQA